MLESRRRPGESREPGLKNWIPACTGMTENNQEDK
jgi:hypothetical protein